MKELPTPTFALSPAFLLRSSNFLGIARVHESQQITALQPTPVVKVQPLPRGITAVWARHLDEVREAQRLRYEIFSGEMGARLDKLTGAVVGTYRVLTPAQARRIGKNVTLLSRSCCILAVFNSKPRSYGPLN
ncbi:MAG: hypothetical protein RL211_2239 [Pseudomonadota bacterium]|jgi:hypothetical protein